LKNAVRQLAMYLLLQEVSESLFLGKGISYNLDGVSKGFGFVTFDKLEDAQKAIQTMNGQKILGKSKYWTIQKH
jgi:RNA recognition motif-containing protein